MLIVIAFLLVLLNGFFVAAEFGLVKLRPTQVKQLAEAHGWRGSMLTRVHRQLDAYLSACQLGITLASLGLGWIGEPAFARLMAPALALLGIDDQEVVHTIAFLVAFLLISYLHIVVGELAPKSLAIRRAALVGLWTAPPLYLFYWLMFPLIWVLNHSANWILRVFGLETAHGHEAQYSPDEIKLILRASRPTAAFSNDEWRLLAKALDFRKLRVADLMRPFAEVAAINAGMSLPAVSAYIAKHRYSRYPFVDATGRVRGIVHIKDVFVATQDHRLHLGLEPLLRPALMVPPGLPAIELFRRFRSGSPHLAVVARHDARPLGFVTLDNLLGALIGNIRDEFRQATSDWRKRDDGSLVGKGNLPLFTLERALGLDIEADEADTIGGLLQQHLRDLPSEGQVVEFDGFSVVVEKMRGPRILRVRVVPREVS